MFNNIGTSQTDFISPCPLIKFFQLPATIGFGLRSPCFDPLSDPVAFCSTGGQYGITDAIKFFEF